MEEIKKCTRCLNFKDISCFHKSSKSPSGLNPACKECVNRYRRKRYSNPAIRNHELLMRQKSLGDGGKKRLEYQKKWYARPSSRAKVLMKGVRDRSHKYTERLNFDYKFLQKKIEFGYCEVTGIPFDLNSKKDNKKRAYSPSIDRIDGSKGYTKDNVRVVIWQFNLMKGELSDCELLECCKAVIRNEHRLIKK